MIQSQSVWAREKDFWLNDYFKDNSVVAGLSTKSFPLFTKKKNFREEVVDRGLFFEKVGLNPKQVIVLGQTHSNHVVEVKEDQGFYGDSDAVFTDLKDVALSIQTADCVPITFVDKDSGVIGLIHAGWKGLEAGIIARTFLAVDKRYGWNLRNVQIAVGPFIHSCCYEFKRETNHNFDSYIEDRNETSFLDLKQMVMDQLLSVGVFQENCFIAEECTSCNTDYFYSYRRDGEPTGRILSFVIKKD